MAKKPINIGCGAAIIIAIILFIIGGAINHAADHMDGITSFIVGTVIVVLFFIVISGINKKQ